MTDDQLIALTERFVVAWEKIASALEGLNETCRRDHEKKFPERSQVREAVVTRVPSREDLLREAQGASSAPLSEWLSDVEQEERDAEDIGVREREWLEAQGARRPGQGRG
jgi:hypothetical protein